MKRELGEVWKDGKDWMLQCPKGRMSFKTKKVAAAWSNYIKENIIKEGNKNGI